MNWFPSPTGSSYFSIESCETSLKFGLSFRPLRGLRISQFWNICKPAPNDRFPSPTGSSYFSMEEYNCSMLAARFPSPTGSSYFSIPSDVCDAMRQILFPSPTGSSYFSIKPAPNDGFANLTFPSPTGSSYFSICQLGVLPEMQKGFRPLRGLRISQSLLASRVIRERGHFGFRPLRGLRISQSCPREPLIYKGSRAALRGKI